MYSDPPFCFSPCAFPPKTPTEEKSFLIKLRSNLEAALMNMTDVPECRQCTTRRARWLWRWLYTLNDIQQMKGKCDWTAFPRGLNIKASPTGNTVNLPRLHIHSTMRGKWAKCTRPIEGKIHVHKQKCTRLNAYARGKSVVKSFETWIVFTFAAAAARAFHTAAVPAFFFWNLLQKSSHLHP